MAKIINIAGTVGLNKTIQTLVIDSGNVELPTSANDSIGIWHFQLATFQYIDLNTLFLGINLKCKFANGMYTNLFYSGSDIEKFIRADQKHPVTGANYGSVEHYYYNMRLTSSLAGSVNSHFSILPYPMSPFSWNQFNGNTRLVDLPFNGGSSVISCIAQVVVNVEVNNNGAIALNKDPEDFDFNPRVDVYPQGERFLTLNYLHRSDSHFKL